MAPDIGKLRLQWLLGEWDHLAEIRHSKFSQHPNRSELVLLAIAGCQQCGLLDDAADLVRLALRWGCSRQDLASWMLASVDNTLGRAYSVIGDAKNSLAAYRSSINGVPGGMESDELAQARAAHQARLSANDSIQNDPKTDTPSHHEDLVFRRPANGITSYAQNFEDVILWRALGTVTEGCYVDIGAQDPIVDSVSRAFYQKGWRGVHVEPTPAYAEKLRKDRPDEIVFQAAVSETGGAIQFYEIPETGISTGDQLIAQGHVGRGFNVRTIVVPCVTLAEVFSSVGDRAIHWLKVDVEGMEASVLKSWNAAPQRPWVIVVESTLPLTEVSNFEDWEPMLLERGYQHVYFDGLNRFYLANERMYLMPAFAAGPNVFDGCVLSGLASTTFHHRP